MTTTLPRVPPNPQADLSGKTVVNLYPELQAHTVQNPWEVPCPRQTHPDIAADHAIQQWVFNHLPLTDPEKLALIADMMKEKEIKERKEKAEKTKEKIKHERAVKSGSKVIVTGRYTIRNGKREPIGSVKTLTK